MLDREFYENLGALKKGIVLPSCNVDESLASMTPEEARKSKRKWRKLMRRNKAKYIFGDKGFMKRMVRRGLSDAGRKIVEGKE